MATIQTTPGGNSWIERGSRNVEQALTVERLYPYHAYVDHRFQGYVWAENVIVAHGIARAWRGDSAEVRVPR